MALTAAYDALDLVDHATAVLQEMIARSQTEYVQPAVLAVAAEHARRHDEALAFLRQAVEIRDPGAWRVRAAFAADGQAATHSGVRGDHRSSRGEVRLAEFF